MSIVYTSFLTSFSRFFRYQRKTLKTALFLCSEGIAYGLLAYPYKSRQP